MSHVTVIDKSELSDVTGVIGGGTPVQDHMIQLHHYSITITHTVYNT